MVPLRSDQPSGISNFIVTVLEVVLQTIGLTPDARTLPVPPSSLSDPAPVSLSTGFSVSPDARASDPLRPSRILRSDAGFTILWLFYGYPSPILHRPALPVVARPLDLSILQCASASSQLIPTTQSLFSNFLILR